MPKKIGLLDRNAFKAQVSDAFGFVDTGGASYPQTHGTADKGGLKKVMGLLQKTENVSLPEDTVQLWEAYLKRTEALVKRWREEASGKRR